MLDNYIELLSQNSQQLIKNGYFKFEIENLKYLNEIKLKFINLLDDHFNIVVDDLSKLHEKLNYTQVNNIRLSYFDSMNESQQFSTEYLELGKKVIIDAVGSELAGNKNVNFSIQMPHDHSSILPIHCDTFSGESEFQINLWVPITNAYGSNSMFIANPDFSKSINDNIDDFETSGLDKLLLDHEEEFQFLDVAYGEGIIFTPTCLHGNIINETDSTRISLNCRYKNIFSPYAKNEENEKKVGSFYKIISPKAATIIGLSNKINY